MQEGLSPRRVDYEEDSPGESPFYKIINGQPVLTEPHSMASLRSGLLEKDRAFLIDEEAGKVLVLQKGYIIPQNAKIHPDRFDLMEFYLGDY